MSRTKLYAVLGPTASGKTRFAVRLAAAAGGEIISADSRQVYRGMDIGTGKDLDEYVCDGIPVPYHLINIAEAGERYDIFRYQRDFASAYNNVCGKGRVPVLCGGSGLYIEAATCNYDIPEVPPDYALRAELEKESDDVLIRKLKAIATPHNTTDFDTRKRLIRALEIAIYKQRNPALPLAGQGPRLPYFMPGDVRYIGLKVSREERNARIDRRLDARLEAGLVDEVRALLDRGLSAEDLIYYGLEYKFVTLYLTGSLTYDEMRSRLAIAIHQFAKRQMTWFRGMERRGINIVWVEPERSPESVL